MLRAISYEAENRLDNSPQLSQTRFTSRAFCSGLLAVSRRRLFHPFLSIPDRMQGRISCPQQIQRMEQPQGHKPKRSHNRTTFPTVRTQPYKSVLTRKKTLVPHGDGVDSGPEISQRIPHQHGIQRNPYNRLVDTALDVEHNQYKNPGRSKDDGEPPLEKLRTCHG